MATFDELVDRACEADNWVKGVETFARIMATIDYKTACRIEQVAEDAVKVMRRNQVNGIETEEMKMRRKYSKEIWLQARMRREWIELQPDRVERMRGDYAVRDWD